MIDEAPKKPGCRPENYTATRLSSLAARSPVERCRPARPVVAFVPAGGAIFLPFLPFSGVRVQNARNDNSSGPALSLLLSVVAHAERRPMTPAAAWHAASHEPRRTIRVGRADAHGSRCSCRLICAGTAVSPRPKPVVRSQQSTALDNAVPGAGIGCRQRRDEYCPGGPSTPGARQKPGLIPDLRR